MTNKLETNQPKNGEGSASSSEVGDGLQRGPATLTLRQAISYTGLSRSFIYKLFDKRLLARLKAGKRVLILKSDLDDYLRSIREAC